MPVIQKRQQRQQIETVLRSAGLYPGLHVRSGIVRPITSRGEGDSGGDNYAFNWVLATEQPVMVFDWERWDFVEEILLMDGMILPANNQVSLLDCHTRSSVDDVLGSVTGFQEAMVDAYKAVEGMVAFAADEKSQNTRQKVKDGHLTDGSVGYGVEKSVWIPEGESAVIKGRTFEGPVKVSYLWHLKEFSATPIGADALAKVRALCRL